MLIETLFLFTNSNKFYHDNFYVKLDTIYKLICKRKLQNKGREVWLKRLDTLSIYTVLNYFQMSNRESHTKLLDIIYKKLHYNQIVEEEVRGESNTISKSSSKVCLHFSLSNEPSNTVTIYCEFSIRLGLINAIIKPVV